MRHSSTSPRTSNMQRVSSCCLPSLCGAARGCNPIHPIQNLDVSSSRARRPCFTHSQHHAFLSVFLRHFSACLAVQCLLKPPFGRRVGACSRCQVIPTIWYGGSGPHSLRETESKCIWFSDLPRLNVTEDRNRQWVGPRASPYRSSHFPRDLVPYRPYHANRTNIVVHSMSTSMRPACVPKDSLQPSLAQLQSNEFGELSIGSKSRLYSLLYTAKPRSMIFFVVCAQEQRASTLYVRCKQLSKR